jgi:hypothetical protein
MCRAALKEYTGICLIFFLVLLYFYMAVRSAGMDTRLGTERRGRRAALKEYTGICLIFFLVLLYFYTFLKFI